MKSPFPGMDPYLEAHWGDVHSRIIAYSCDAIQLQLPSHLRARMQERVYVELPEGARREHYPDTRVFEYPGRRARTGEPILREESGVAVADPVLIDMGPVQRTESYIEVIDVKSGHRVVTSIEVLSPTNKIPGEGQRLYLQKREIMRQAGVNTVEIDLLRSGELLFGIDPQRVPASHRTAYQVWIWRSSVDDRLALFATPLRLRLPAIPIPLCPGDADVTLDLQAILDECYSKGGYDDINYRVPASPPLDPADEAWADALLREKGLR
jgi:hypothetical protein